MHIVSKRFPRPESPRACTIQRWQGKKGKAGEREGGRIRNMAESPKQGTFQRDLYVHTSVSYTGKHEGTIEGGITLKKKTHSCGFLKCIWSL